MEAGCSGTGAGASASATFIRIASSDGHIRRPEPGMPAQTESAPYNGTRGIEQIFFLGVFVCSSDMPPTAKEAMGEHAKNES